MEIKQSYDAAKVKMAKYLGWISGALLTVGVVVGDFTQIVTQIIEALNK